ncbi:MAG: DUF3846 domain-containing protein [Eubacteriales bacterium]
MKTAYVIKIAVNGEITPVEVDGDNLLKELQKLVGGSIEVSPRCWENGGLNKRQSLIVNEEGKLKGLPENPTATIIAGLVGVDMLVGDAILVKRKYDDILPFDSLDYVRRRIIEPLEDRLGSV